MGIGSSSIARIIRRMDRPNFGWSTPGGGLRGAGFGFEKDDPPHILVAHNANVIFVVFRGTRIDRASDIIADVEFLPTFTTQGFLHRGFQNALGLHGAWDGAQLYLAGIGG